MLITLLVDQRTKLQKKIVYIWNKIEVYTSVRNHKLRGGSIYNTNPSDDRQGMIEIIPCPDPVDRLYVI
jgi:hypothetical protein